VSPVCQYGGRAEVAWFNSQSGEWEVIAGTEDADTRTITIPVDHFSTYALFAEDVLEVPLPDVTKLPEGSSDNSFPWFWMLICAVFVVVGGILFAGRRTENGG